MIQANELRIGNWIMILKEKGSYPYEVSSGHDIEEIEGCPESVMPIPLSEEIMLACGFKKYSHEPGYSLGSDELDEKCDQYSMGKLTIMDWGNGFVLSNSFSFDLRVEIKSLHQLQNLIFAIIATELIYNPSTKEI